MASVTDSEWMGYRTPETSARELLAAASAAGFTGRTGRWPPWDSVVGHEHGDPAVGEIRHVRDGGVSLRCGQAGAHRGG